MHSTWRRPGLRAALLYAVAAGVLGLVVSWVSRVELPRRSVSTPSLPTGPVIVIANHTSFVDGILLALVGRRLGRCLRLMATGGVFRSALVGPVVRRLGFIPVLRGTDAAAGSLDAAATALAAGEAVGLFPEGRITRDPGHWPERSKTGAVRLALRTGAPIVPVAMVGAHDVVGRTHIVARLLRNTVCRPRVAVQVGAPIDVRQLAVGDRHMSRGMSGDEPADGEPAGDAVWDDPVWDGAVWDEAQIRRVSDEVMAVLVSQVAALRAS